MKLTDLLDLSIKSKASDLHLSAGLPPMMRIDGVLAPVDSLPPLDPMATQELLYSVMTNDQRAEFEQKLDIDFAIMLPDIARFRVNAFHQTHGIAAVFRNIPTVVPTLESLELPAIFKDLLDFPNGLILITGPTGSGKSTTLAAMLNYLNQNKSLHIITIEDPIEFMYQSQKSLINQRQIDSDALDFTSALRASLREDPDVIMLGEMRDLESIRLALTAAETGHLVITTLHTSSAPHAINRIVDVFPGDEKNIIRKLLSESLRAVICQTLMRKPNGGRAPAFEIMLGSPAIRNLIREDNIAQMYATIQTNSALGMCTLDQYLQGMVEKNMITSSIAREAAVNKNLFVGEIR